jgi:peptide/nickel transport system substrate-binding protein
VRPWRVVVALVVVIVAVVVLRSRTDRAPATQASSAARGGQTLRFISPLRPARLKLDPAQALLGYQSLYYATCAPLMVFRDAPAPAGFTVRPEAAAGPPQVSRDGRTYVFTVRTGLRFSDGSPIKAGSFARALERVQDRAMRSPGASLYADVIRARASGQRLRIDLRRPSGDLPARLALPYACPVPVDFPVGPAGFPLLVGSGPYYVSRPAPNRLVLQRNPYYRGTLPHRADRIVATFGGQLDDSVRAVAQGRADVLVGEIPGDVRKVLARRYGVNRRQLFRERGLYTVALAFNTTSRLFRGNVPLRKAVNLAIDRPAAVTHTLGGSLSNMPTDQIMPSGSAGWVDHHLYPLRRPDLARARRLATGHLRGGTAVLYTPAGELDPAMAATIAANLAKIGLKVEIKPLAPAVLLATVGKRGARFDMVLGSWPDELFGPVLTDLEPPLVYRDPANMLVRYLGGESARKASGNANVAYFDLSKYNRRMATDARLSGPARFRAFSRLDADIMRDQAPWAPILEASTWRFVSRRVGCVHLRPQVGMVWGDLCVAS